MNSVDYCVYIGERICQLRFEKNLSARDMSLTLGQSASYINKIENKKALPSMEVFLQICDFFQITPSEFFDKNLNHPSEYEKIIRELRKLDSSRLIHIYQLLDDLNNR